MSAAGVVARDTWRALPGRLPRVGLGSTPEPWRFRVQAQPQIANSSQPGAPG